MVSAEPAVSICGLSFHYAGSETPNFRGLDLEIRKGQRFGLFGPNGAGKTTLLSLMTGVLRPVQGSIRLMGKDVSRHRMQVNRCFGFVPQDFSFYEELSPVENLKFFGAWSGLSRKQIGRRTDELLYLLGLEDVRNKPVANFSGGMKRRLNLAIGVIHNPPVLVLDEPTVGVDVQTRHAMISYLTWLNREGTTLIYTSHQLAEAEELCEVAALIDDGRIIAHGKISRLLEEHQQEDLEHLYLELTGKEYRDDV